MMSYDCICYRKLYPACNNIWLYAQVIKNNAADINSCRILVEKKIQQHKGD